MNTSSSLSRSENSAERAGSAAVAASVVKLCIFPRRIFARGRHASHAENAARRRANERVAASLTPFSPSWLLPGTRVREKVEEGDAKFPPSFSPCRSFSLATGRGCRSGRGSGGGGVTLEGNSFLESYAYVPPSSKKESPESNKGSGSDCVARSARGPI